MLTYDKDKPLGEGKFATVFLGKLDTQAVAVKIIDMTQYHQSHINPYTEAQIQQTLQHENIVKLHQFSHKQNEKYSYCTLEFMASGDLFNILHRYQLPLSAYAYLTIAKDIISGLDYLHARGFLHRDIKPENILFNAQMRAKIGDFGFAIQETNGEQPRCSGTIFYIAPELAEAAIQNQYNKKSANQKKYQYTRLTDVYATGMTLLHMMCRDQPYGKSEKEMLFDDIIQGKHYKIPDNTPKLLTEVISQCLIKNPNDRMFTPNLLSILNPHVISTEQDKYCIGFFAAKNGDLETLKRVIEHLNINDKESNAQGNSLLHLSAAGGHAVTCTFLIEYGANIRLENNRYKTAEALWPTDSKQDNPFNRLRQDLINLAWGKYVDRQDILQELIFSRNTDLLTWKILQDDLGNFINICFAYGNMSCIEKLTQHPKWQLLSQTRTSKNFTILHVIANKNQIKAYDYIRDKIDINDKRNSYGMTALHIAALKSHVEFCELLLNNKAKMLKNNDHKTADELWVSKPGLENPFRLYLCAKEFKNKKEQINTVLREKRPTLHWCAFFNSKETVDEINAIEHLSEIIDQAKFDPHASDSLTADELLKKAIDDWACDNRLEPNASNEQDSLLVKNGMFSSRERMRATWQEVRKIVSPQHNAYTSLNRL